MAEIGLIIILYAVAALILLAEVFIPSHGVLGMAGLGFLTAAVYQTFIHGGQTAGVVAVLACMVALPTLAFVTIKFWRRTPIGRRIAPPNPVLGSADSAIPVEQLTKLVGRRGKAISPLRPVGICDFDGERISCVAEFGQVEAGSSVLATSLKSGNLAVRSTSEKA